MLSAQPQNLYFHHLIVENGLSKTNNQYLFQDSRGLVWVSSMDGVNRFDGRKVKVWKPDPRDTAGMMGSNVQGNFFEDEKSNIWFCTFDALNCYLRNEDRIFHLPEDKDEEGKPVLGYYAFHLDASQVLWVVERQQTLRFFDTRTRQFLPARYELMPGIQKAHVLTDSAGQKIVLSYRNDVTGMCVTTLLNGGGMRQRWLLKHPLKDRDKYLVGCWPESDTAIWIAHFRGFGKLNLRLRTEQFISYFETPEGSDLYPRDVCPLDDHRLLVGFGQNGVFVFDKDSLRFTERHTYRPDQPYSAPLGGRNVVRFEHGDVFVNSVSAGISYTNLHKNKFITLLPPYSNRRKKGPVNIWALAEDAAGNSWCLTSDAQLIILDAKKRVKAWHLPDPLHAGALPQTAGINLFTDHKNRCWILTWNGLWMLDSPRHRSFRQLTDADQVFLHGIQLQDDHRILLTSFTGGIYEVKEKGTKISFEKIKAIDDSKAYTTLFQDKKGLLYACRELTDIAVFDPGKNFIKIDSMPVQGEINGWYEPAAGDVFWIATSYGLVRWHKREKKMTIFNEKNGLPNQNIHAVLPGSLGQLWLSSNRGLIRFNPADSSAHAFTLADGLPALEFNTFAALRKNNGELWFGSPAGIATFHPDSIHYLPPPKRVLITDILVNDQISTSLVCALTGARNPMEIRQLELLYSENTLSFEFVAPEYADPDQVRYRYQLKGYDKNPVDAGSRGFARFANIPPGNDTLLLWAFNSDGVPMQEPTLALVITIIPPIWMRWWFILSAIVAFISAIWYAIAAYYRRREHIRRLQAEKELAVEKERLRISRDLHDDLGSGIGAIGLLSDIALSKTGDAEMRIEVGKIAESSRDLSAKIREIIWAASARNDTLEKLVGYLHQYAVSLFAGSDIELRAHLPADLPAATVPGERRRAVFLAFKEALNNIVRHAGATRADLQFAYTDRQLTVRIGDNGRGFDPLTVGDTGNGLVNMRQRVEGAGGQFRLESGGNGTTVTFILPF